MNVELRSELKLLYPRAIFGGLMVENVTNNKKNPRLEKEKRDLEAEIREDYPDVDQDEVIRSYDTYYKKWGKTYPIEFQVKTIKGGRNFPQVSTLVDSMFLAELRNRVLTSGHDQDRIQSDLWFDLSDEGETYLKLNGKEQELPKSDIILRDRDDILASVLYGPARKTSISSETSNPLYFAWCPYKFGESTVEEHLMDIVRNLELVYGSFKYETIILE
jgi:DNA/RNA-binding domain of Phe-tRNA-synthetase-like protein